MGGEALPCKSRVAGCFVNDFHDFWFCRQAVLAADLIPWSLHSEMKFLDAVFFLGCYRDPNFGKTTFQKGYQVGCYCSLPEGGCASSRLHQVVGTGFPGSLRLQLTGSWSLRIAPNPDTLYIKLDTEFWAFGMRC